jgi:hypothetical protein
MLNAASLERLIFGWPTFQLLGLTSAFSSAPLLSGLAASHWDDVEAASSLKRFDRQLLYFSNSLSST